MKYSAEAEDLIYDNVFQREKRKGYKYKYPNYVSWYKKGHRKLKLTRRNQQGAERFIKEDLAIKDYDSRLM